ncbi:Agamous-like MADS-box protein AGL80 [Linum perenne]
MGRKIVKLARIENERARRQTMARRQKGLMKKVDELTILCGVSALCIIYNPTVGEPAKPLIWPSNDGKIEELLQGFYSIPDIERHMRMTTQEQYLKQMTSKTNEMHANLRKKNNNLETAILMDEVHFGKGLQGMDLQEIYDLEWLLNKKIRALRRKRDGVEPLPPAPFDFSENVTPEARTEGGKN